MRLAPLYLSSLADNSKFSSPITRFQPLKSHFLMAVLPLLSPVFNGSRRFCLSFDVYFYAFCLAVSGILHCIQHHFALHLAPKRTAFSTKIHCVQHQNALRLAPNTLRLAPKCSAFCGILHRILQQIAQKLVQIAVMCNDYSYCQHLYATPFCIKTNLREN